MKENLILIVDDDPNICKVMKLYLEKEGYTVEVAENGERGVELFLETSPAMVLMDIMMPKMNGLDAVKEIRKTSNVPIMMITAKGETFDKVLGLELGADDYIVKPFDPKEMVARVKAVLRRSSGAEEKQEKVEYEDIVINLSNYTVIYCGKELELPPKELELLYFLATHPNKVFTREQLLQNVWEFDFFGDSRTVDVHVKRLREKINGEHNWQIKTVWGVGYKFEVK